MQDQIIIIDTIDEVYDLGWTYLGRIYEEEAYQNVGEIWCNDDKFVLLADRSFQYRSFTTFLSREEALKKLFNYERRRQRLMAAKNSLSI